VAFVYAFLWAASGSSDDGVRFLRPALMVTDQMSTVWTVQVDPKPEYRLLVVGAADGEEVIRCTDIQLDGAKARRTQDRFIWRPLPAGEMVIIAAVSVQARTSSADCFGGLAVVAMARTRLIVVGMGP
jgi:hypothetical protein